MKFDRSHFPDLFKGIALFTPGGDLIYAIDPSKQDHWHIHLCVGLQELLGLPEPPHFLVPGYTGTIDRWLDSQTQQLRTSAEIYRPVHRHQALLNAVFGTSNLVWQVASWKEESCDPMVLETYRERFPQLWEDHDLIVRFDRTEQPSLAYTDEESYSTATSSFQDTDYLSEYVNSEDVNREVWQGSFSQSPLMKDSASSDSTKALGNLDTNAEEPDTRSQPLVTHSYVLRLFISGHRRATECTLQKLHELLEHSLRCPYTLTVIDVFKHPDQAEANHISATPTLIRVWPQPVRRIVGDLNNVENLLRIIAAPEA